MRRSVVAIGNFDGVHTGHQYLLAQARRKAAELADEHGSLPVLVVTFWPHPLSIIAPQYAPKLLNTLPQRIDLLRKYGADEVRVVQFSAEVADWSPEHFVETILLPLNPAAVVVGTNFTFGKKAAGTGQKLVELAGDDFAVELVELSSIENDLTCSTLVRSAISEGDVTKAATHLGRKYSVRGVVVVGDQRGRLLGFPTANLVVNSDMVIPADGVYAGWLTRLDSPDIQPMPVAISVGTNPTFDGVQRRVESYVLDRHDLELYGIEIQVDFIKHLRGQVRFDSKEELIEQMNADVANTRLALGLPTE